MKVKNINDYVRNYLYNKYTARNMLNTEEFVSDMNNLKIADYTRYKNLICGLYPIFYLVTKQENDIHIEFDIKEYDGDPDLEEIENISDSPVYRLPRISSPSELLAEIEDDEYILSRILTTLFIFIRSNEFQKRELFNVSPEIDKYLLSFSKNYYMDKLEYCHLIEKDEFIDKINSNIDPKSDEPERRFEKVDSAYEYLYDLEEVDPAAYDYLLQSIVEDSYKYQKYLYLNGYGENDKFLKFNIYFMENDIDYKSSNFFVETVLDYFFDFHEKSIDFRNNVYSYFEKNKEKNKMFVKKKDSNS